MKKKKFCSICCNFAVSSLILSPFFLSSSLPISLSFFLGLCLCSYLIFKTGPKVQVILAAVLHLQIWKTLCAPE